VSIFNKPKLVGLKASLGVGDGKKSEYSIDSTVALTSLKKKTLFKPLVSVRSPTAELLAVGGTFGLYDDKVDYNLVMDKITEKKIALKGQFNCYLYVDLFIKGFAE